MKKTLVNLSLLEFQRAMLREGIAWPHNVTRHSFCSYHFGKFRDEKNTALESGNTPQMLFSNYREVVTPELENDYFSIFPTL